MTETAATDELLARAKARLADGTLTTEDLDELAQSGGAPKTKSRRKKFVTRQRLMYLHASSPSIRANLIAHPAVHEPVPGSVTQIDPLAKELPYNSVFEAILDGWRVIHFPQQLAPYDDREIDVMGYEFVLEKLEQYEG